mmetsp:Transcript_10224/g.42189  ORF Transcript_10224/g.42189 Transcript_10224/m.42189 type:complete len:260 (-) Transcript_10224:867-1646(-)
MIRVSIASMRANLCSISLNRSAASLSKPPPPPPPPPPDPSLSLCGRGGGVTCVSQGADPPIPAASSSSRILRRRSRSSRRAMVLTIRSPGDSTSCPATRPLSRRRAPAGVARCEEASASSAPAETLASASRWSALFESGSLSITRSVASFRISSIALALDSLRLFSLSSFAWLLRYSSTKLLPMSVMGMASTTMPESMVITATIRPMSVIGYMSPYPTVVIVTMHQYIARGIESNGNAGSGSSKLSTSDGFEFAPIASA